MDPRRARREGADSVARRATALLSLALLGGAGCGESVDSTPGSAGHANAGSVNGAGGSAGSAPGGGAGTNASAGTAGSSSSFGGGTFAETHVPAVPHVGTDDETLEGLYNDHDPRLEITHSHLVPEKPRWFGTVKNAGGDTLCQAFLELRFLLADGRVERALGGVFGTTRDTPERGTWAQYCLAPGESGDAEALLLGFFSDISLVTEVRYVISVGAELGAPRTWLTIEDGAWRDAGEGQRAFGGRIRVGDWPIRSAAVWVAPKTAAGLPLAMLGTTEHIVGALPPGSTVDFVSEPFGGTFAGYTVSVGAIGDLP